MTASTLNTAIQTGVHTDHSTREAKTSIDWLRTGHTAVITGAANGIGRAAAEIFLANGMQVVIADNNAEALAAAAEDLHAYQDRLEVMTCDVSNYAQVCHLRG
jgi:NADP-dependent 3-hydroxy acid dehydrogenase YdfG